MHGTCACCADKIVKEGMNEYSYLTTSETVADYYAEVTREECDCEDEVILAVEVHESELLADTNSFDEPLTFVWNEHADSESDWHDMIESGEIPYPEKEDYKTSLEYVGSVVHKSIILSSNISIYSPISE